MVNIYGILLVQIKKYNILAWLAYKNSYKTASPDLDLTVYVSLLRCSFVFVFWYTCL